MRRVDGFVLGSLSTWTLTWSSRALGRPAPSASRLHALRRLPPVLLFSAPFSFCNLSNILNRDVVYSFRAQIAWPAANAAQRRQGASSYNRAVVQAPSGAQKRGGARARTALRLEDKDEDREQDDEDDDRDGAPCRQKGESQQPCKQGSTGETHRSPSPCAKMSRAAAEPHAGARTSGRPAGQCPRAARDGRRARRRSGARGGAAGQLMTRGSGAASLAL